jgi:ParB-like chromosome segregation protein Spo0J
MELCILPEIQQRLLPLRDEELRELERSVLDEGIRDPLVVWRKDGQLILVDGHHRYELRRSMVFRSKSLSVNFATLMKC